MLVDAFASFKPVHDGHVDVEHYDFVIVVRHAANHLQRLHTILCLVHQEVLLQLLFVSEQQKLVVIDKQHSWFIHQKFI